jgi:predicted transcriptional regulator
VETAIDAGLAIPYAFSMEVSFSTELQDKLMRLAVQPGSDSNSLVVEAVERMVDYDEWFLREVEKGEAAAARGEFVVLKDIGKMITSRFSS